MKNMKPINIYLRAVASLLLAVFGWGFLAPPLVSSPTDAGLIAGVVVVFAVPAGIYYLLKPIFKSKTKENEKN